MNEREIRERIRELMVAGALPPTLADSSLVSESGLGVPAQVHVGPIDLESCAICGQPSPELSYYYPGGRILRFHSSCDLLWQVTIGGYNVGAGPCEANVRKRGF